MKECIIKSNDPSLTITPTAPALPIPHDAVPLDEQADTNHPHNIFTIPPPSKRLIDAGNDVEEVNNAILTEHLNTRELDVPCLQGVEKIHIDDITENVTYIDKDGKSLRMPNGRDQTEIKRVVRKSIRKPETEGKHSDGILENGKSENITINTNSGVITDHTRNIANLAKQKCTGHTQEVTTPELRIHSNNVKINIEDKNVQPDRKKNTVQDAGQDRKIQPDQSVRKNKTTTRKPRKEKNKFEDDNAKLGLYMKTWLNNKNKSSPK